MLERRASRTTGTLAVLVLAQFGFLLLLAVAHRGLTQTFNPGWGFDVVLYHWHSLSLTHGLLPYVGFAFEYPPLALIPMFAPHLLGTQANYYEYEIRYLLLGVLLSTIIAFALVAMVALHKPRRRPVPVLGMYLLLLIPAALLALWRYDLFPATLTLLAILAVVRGNSVIAGLCLGVAIGAKLYPVVLLPILAAYLYVPGARRQAAWFIATAALVVAIPLVPLFIADPTAALSFVRYQVERPLEIGTVPAAAIRLAALIGFIPRPQRVEAFRAENISSPEAGAALILLPIVAAALFALVFVGCVLRFRQEYTTTQRISTATLSSFCMLALIVFLTTAKVFSPQYVIWLLPLAPLLPARQALIVGGILTLTFVVFPGAWNQYLAYDPMPVIALNLRNLLLVALLVQLLIELAPAGWRQTLMGEARNAVARLIPEIDTTGESSTPR